MIPPSPYPLLGPSVVIDQRMALPVSRLLARARREFEFDGVTLSADLVELIESVEALANYATRSHAAPKPVDLDATMTTADAAALLGISERAVRYRLQAGTLAGTKRSGAWRPLVSAVLESAEAAEVTGWAC